MDHALKYAADGFAVFPVHEPIAVGVCSCPHGSAPMIGDKKHSIGKHPRTMNGVSDATMDETTIRGWWTKWPNASVGIATGKRSGLSVVDLDGLEGISSGKRLGLRSTVTVLTGNGEQLYYADPSGSLNNSVRKLAAGMDIRGNGGYVVAPPSLHPNGKRYAWRTAPLSRTVLSALPQSFGAQSSASSGTTSTLRKPSAPNWVDEAIAKLRDGHVHNNLVSVLGKFRTANFSEEATYALLKPHALENGRPFEGLRDKIAEIWKRYQAAPTQGPSKSETIDEFLKDVKEPEWICKPFIGKKSIGFVAGLPETLKTWLLADLAVECARGSGMWLGTFPMESSALRVLFIDQERWKGETKRRFNALLAAKGLEPRSLEGRLSIKSGTTIKLNLDQSYQAFRTELMEMRPQLVIVDSFATFHTAQEKDRTEIQKVLERVKELRNDIGCTFAFINHETKYAYPNGEEQGEPNAGTMAGSVGIIAAAEFMLTVRKVEEGTSIIWHTKSTLGPKHKSFYATVKDLDSGIEVKALND